MKEDPSVRLPDGKSCQHGSNGGSRGLSHTGLLPRHAPGGTTSHRIPRNTGPP